MNCPLNPLDRIAYHDSLKEGPLAAWNKLKPLGTQEVEAEGGLPGYTVDCRDCECGSTLYRELGPVIAGDELATHLRDVIERFFRTRLAQSHLRTKRQDPYIVLTANTGTRVFLDHMAKAIAEELEKDESPTHCPGCDGDHL